MIEILEVLDNTLDDLADSIISGIQEDEYSNEVFSTKYVFHNEKDRPLALKGKHGVYIIKMIEDVHLTREQVRRWNECGAGASFNHWRQGDLHNGEILYVGSCISTSLYVRIRQHFLNQTTATSLKLGCRARNMVYDAVVVYAFSINSIYKPHERIIIPQVEKRLHDILVPLAGSSKV